MLQEEIRRLGGSKTPSAIATSGSSAGAISTNGKSTCDAQQPVVSEAEDGADAAAAAIDQSNSDAVNVVSSLMWRVKLGENGETALIGPSGNFCFSGTETETRDKGPNEGEHPSQDSGSHELRSSKPLVSLFVKHVNSIHHFVDDASITALEQAEPLYESFLGSAILAAGAVYSDHVEDIRFGDQMAAAVEAVALETCRKTPNLATVQALCIMCWRELGLGRDNMTWMYNGMACALALHLGLTVSPLQPASCIFDESMSELMQSQYQRLRTLWSVVLLDRQVTSHDAILLFSFIK